MQAADGKEPTRHADHRSIALAVGEVGGDGEEGEGHKELHHYLKGVDPLPSALSRHEQTQPTRLSHDVEPVLTAARTYATKGPPLTLPA